MKNNISRRWLAIAAWAVILGLLISGFGIKLAGSIENLQKELSSVRAQAQTAMLKNDSLVEEVESLQESSQALVDRNYILQSRNYLLSAKSTRLYKETKDLQVSVENKDKKIGNLNAEVQSLLSELSSQKESLPKEPEVKATKTTVTKTKKPNSSKPSNVRRVLYPEATAYGASKRNGGAGTGRTYTGVAPVEGRTIAADPKVLPMGTVVWIECPSFPSINGRYVVEDIGGAINGSRIDIYMDDSKRSTMLDFGRRQVTLSVLSN